MEPRVLLSADVLGIDAALLDPAVDGGADWQTLHPPADPLAVRDAPETTDQASELVFLDAGVADGERLLAELLARNETAAIQVFLIDADSDGVERIAQILAGQHDIDAIHILSHGSPGQLQLGKATLSADSLDGYSGQLIDWGSALAGDGDILFYGCDLAAGEQGEALIDAIGVMTGADVAASVDPTGDAAQGGDWDLEYAVGEVVAPLGFDQAQMPSWNHTLSLIAYEGFDYAVGSFDGASGGSGWASPWSSPGDKIETFSGAIPGSVGTLAFSGGHAQLVMSGLTDTVEQVRQLTTSLGADGTTAWVSWLVQPNDIAGLEHLGLKLGTDTGTESERLWVGFVDNDFQLSNGDGSGSFTVHDVISAGTSYLFTLEMVFKPGADDLTLYVDSKPGLPNPDPVHVAGIKSDLDLGSFTQVSIVGGLGNNPSAIDEIRIGNTIADVTPVAYYLDEFNATAYDGNDGSMFWNGDWQEVGDDGLVGSGQIQVANHLGEDRLRIEQDGMGAVRTADLTGMAQATLSFDYTRQNMEADDAVVVEISVDGGNWFELGRIQGADGSDAAFEDVGFDISGYLSGDTRLRYVASGMTDADDHFYVDNVRIDAAATPPEVAELWLSTDGDVVAGGQAGDDTWNMGDLVSIGDPNLDLGVTTTGTFATQFGGEGFAAGWNLQAAHYVSAPLQIGSTGFQLEAGDLLLSPEAGTSFASNSLAVLDTANGFAATLVAAQEDLVLFRPDEPGDLAHGQFRMLIEDLSGGHDLRGISLVEQDTTVGGHVLEAGDFLYTRMGGPEANGIWLYQTDTTGYGASPDARQELVSGDDPGVGIAGELFGVELIERTTQVGDETLSTGALLVSVNASGAVGGNAASADAFDVVRLDVVTASLVSPGNGSAIATRLFDGSDVAFDSGQEVLNAVALAPAVGVNADPGDGVAIAEGDALTLDGSGSYDGDGTIASWEWDIGNDGSFEKSGEIVSFGWAELNAAGVVDDSATGGPIEIALRVTDNDGNTDLALTTLDVSNTAPTFMVSAANTAVAGQSYSLDLTVTDPGDDTISSYTINWGDGSVTTAAYGGSTTTVTHVYDQIGFTRNITFSALDEDAVAEGIAWTPSDLIAGAWVSGDAIYRFDGETGFFDSVLASSGGEVNKPYSPVFGPDGNLYVGGYDSDNIVRYAPDGSYLGEFIAAGELEPGVGLDQPSYGLAWGADGNLYVANENQDNILRFDDQGNYLGVFGVAGGLLDGPAGLAFGPDGDLYVSSWLNHKILKYDGLNGGNPSVVLEAGLAEPDHLLFDGAGNLLIANAGTDQVLQWDGATLTPYLTHAELAYPTGLTFGPDGALYVASYDNDSVLRHDGTTTTFVESGDGGLGKPAGIVFTPSHQVLVTSGNTAPTATNLTTGSDYTEGDASVAIDDIVVTDPDAAEAITATLTLENTATGSLSANDGAVYDAGTGVWSISGDVASVNSALANLVYLPLADNDLDATIAVSIDDGDEDASGPLSGTITLNVIPVNDSPLTSGLPSTSNYNEGDATVAITDIVVGDVDSGEIINATLTLADTATGSLSANDGAAYDAGTGVWTISGDVATVNTALANLVFNPNAENDVNTLIGVQIDDGDEDGSGPLSGTIALNVSGANDAPTATNLSSSSAYNEGDPSVAIADIAVSDADTGETITATLTLANTAAGSLSANDGASYDGATGIWTITDTLANVNVALANLVFQPVANNEQDTTIAVVIDDGDEEGSGPLTGTITLDVTAANDPPTATNLTSTSTYNEGESAISITDIVVSDADAGDAITATLTVADTSTGSLSANDGASYDAGSGEWSISGDVAAVNTALANLVFNPTTENDRDTTIAVSIDDGDEDAGGPLTGTITLDVTPVNDRPMQSGIYDLGSTGVTTATTGLRVDALLAGITASDVDGDMLGLAVIGHSGLGIWQYSVNTTDGVDGSWNAFGVVAPASALLLDDTTWVRYSPDGATAETATFEFRAWDQSAGLASIDGSPSYADSDSASPDSAFGAGSAAVTLAVSDVLSVDNDAYSTNENDVLSVAANGVLDNDELLGAPAVTPGATLEYLARADGNANNLWKDAGGVPNYDADFGGTTITLDTSPANAPSGITASYVFDGSGRMQIADAMEALPGDPTDGPVSFELWIRPSDASGTEILLDLGSATTAAGCDGASLRLNGPTLEWLVWNDGGTASVKISADIGGEIASGEFIQIVAGFDPGSGSTSLRVDGVLVNSTANATVTSWASLSAPTGIGGIGGTATLVHGTPGGDHFEGEIAAFRIYESVLSEAEAQRNIDATFLTVVSHDLLSAGGANVSVGADGGLSYDPGSAFDSLAVGESADDTFNYTAQTSGGAQDDATVTVTVHGVNDDPTAIGLSADTVNQSGGVDTTIGTLSASDVDDSDTHAFSLVPGAGDTDNASFRIAGDTLQAVDAGALAAGSYSVRVQADDGNGGTVEAAFSITVVDDLAPGAPTDDDVAANEVHGATASGTTVGVTALSADSPASTVSYTLDDTAGGRFAIAPDTGVVSVANGGLLHQGTDASHTITVRATDAAGNATTRDFTISVLNNDPTAISLSSNAVDQADGSDADVGTLSASDPDLADTHGFTLVAGPGDTDNAAFQIVGDTLQAVDAGAMAVGSYSVRVQASDGQGGLFADALTISVTDEVLPEVPVDTDLAANRVDEGAAAGTAVGLTAHSTDGGVSYSLDDDAGGRFAIDAASGVVTVAAAGLIDYEDASSHDIIVRVTDVGADFTTETFTITVGNIAPTAANDRASTGENELLTAAAADGVLANDSDPNGFGGRALVSAVGGLDSNVGTAVAGSGGGLFTIHADGSYRFDPGNDFDDLAEGAARDTNLSYTVSDGALSATATLVITVNGANDALVADDETVTLVEGGRATEADLVSGASLLDGDLATDAGGTLQIDTTPVVDVSHGSLALNADGTFVYVHDGSENFSDAFTYRVSNGLGASDTAEVTIDIVPQNDNAPFVTAVLPDRTASVGEAFGFSFASTLFADDDVGDTLSYTAGLADGGALPAWLGFDAAGRSFSGTPGTDDAGALDIRVTATDGAGASVSQSFALTVEDHNQAPEIGRHALSLSAGERVVLSAANLSASDPDGTDDDLLFAVSAVEGGHFELADAPGVAINSFTQAQVAAGEVVFVDDGDGTAPRFRVSVSDGTASSGPVDAVVTLETASTTAASASVASQTPAVEMPAEPGPAPRPAQETEPAAEPEAEPEAAVEDEAGDEDIEAEVAAEAEPVSNPASVGVEDAGATGLDVDAPRPAVVQPAPALLKQLFGQPADLAALSVPAAMGGPFELSEVAREVRTVLGSSDFNTELDRMRQQVVQATVIEQALVGSGAAVTTGLSVGYVAWLIRGGVLLSTALSSLPAWQFIDPLPVLARTGDGEDGDDDSLEAIIKEQSSRAANKADGGPEQAPEDKRIQQNQAPE